MTAAAARYDRSSILRDAWALAKAAAAKAIEPVRQHIGAAMRAAWAAAKATLQAPAKAAIRKAGKPVQLCLIEYLASLPPVEAHLMLPAAPAATPGSPARQSLLDRIKENGRAMARLRHEIERNVAVNLGACYSGDEYRLLDDLRAYGIELHDELAALDAPSTPGPDLSSQEGLKAALVGRSSPLPLDGGKAVYTVTDITRWASSDGTLVRDYLRFRLSGMPHDEAAGPVGVFVERAGGAPKHAALPMTTRAGKVWWSYGKECVSGGQRWAADKMARSLLAVIEA